MKKTLDTMHIGMYVGDKDGHSTRWEVMMKETVHDKEIRENNAKLERELYFIVKGTMFELEDYVRDKFIEGASCSWNRINDDLEYERYVEIRRMIYNVTSKLLDDMKEVADKHSVELENRIKKAIIEVNDGGNDERDR